MTPVNPYEASAVEEAPRLLRISNWNRAGGILTLGLVLCPAVVAFVVWDAVRGTLVSGHSDAEAYGVLWLLAPLAAALLVYSLAAPILWMEIWIEHFRYRKPLRVVAIEWENVERVTLLNEVRSGTLLEFVQSPTVLLAIVIDNYHEVHVPVPVNRLEEVVHVLRQIESVQRRPLLRLADDEG